MVFEFLLFNAYQPGNALMLKLYAGKVGVPRQLVIKKDASSISDAVAKYGLTLPLGMHMFTFIESFHLQESFGQCINFSWQLQSFGPVLKRSD